MSFFLDQPASQRREYQKFLTIAGRLSRLFSDSNIPYLYYRMAEKIFCRSFKAEDLSRNDISSDAKKETVGIGLKTFLIGNSKTFQKIAEFNHGKSLYDKLNAEKLIHKIAELRNERIDFTQNSCGLNRSIYHCVIRDEDKFIIFEEPMDEIQTDAINEIKENKGSLTFNDGLHEYSFLPSKSTLTKRFIAGAGIYEFKISILENPLFELEKLIGVKRFQEKSIIKTTIFLPLYGSNQIVFEKSGLNQWNASGRPRDANEAYIPIPSKIHSKYPDFFPNRDAPFNLKLPDGKKLESKICQDGGKALMSCSNKELGKWILRDVLRLPEGKLLTYQKLQNIGIDSVRIDKISQTEFEISFSKIGSFEIFERNYLS